MAYEVTLDPVPEDPYSDGMIVNFKVHVENVTGSPDVTLDVNGVGARPLQRNGAISLSGGELKEDHIASVIYDADGSGQFILLHATAESLNIDQVNGLEDALEEKLNRPDSTPSYTNALGSGDRRSSIDISSNHPSLVGTLSNMLDGAFANNFYWAEVLISGIYVRFDFKAPVQITQAKWYQDNSASHGDWKWQGSNDASSWTDIGSTFTLGGSSTQTMGTLSGNNDSYRYYQMLGTSGSSSSSPWLREIEFRVSAVPLAEALLLVPISSHTRFVRADASHSLLEATDMPAKQVLVLPKTASQTVNSGNTDKLTYNTASTNDGAFTVSSSVLTTVIPGDYLFEIPCFVSGGTAIYSILIAVNGSLAYKSMPATTVCSAVKKLRLAGGDTVEFRLAATSANCLVDTTDAYLNNVVVTRLN